VKRFWLLAPAAVLAFLLVSSLSAAGTDPSTAFDVLRQYARNHNMKLHDVCRAVLAGNLPRLTH